MLYVNLLQNESEQVKILISVTFAWDFIINTTAPNPLPPWHFHCFLCLKCMYYMEHICSSSAIKAQWGMLRFQVKFVMLIKAVYQLCQFSCITDQSKLIPNNVKHTNPLSIFGCYGKYVLQCWYLNLCPKMMTFQKPFRYL